MPSSGATANVVRHCHDCQALHEGRGRGHPGFYMLRGPMPRAASNGGTIPRGGAHKSLTTNTLVGDEDLDYGRERSLESREYDAYYVIMYFIATKKQPEIITKKFQNSKPSEITR